MLGSAELIEGDTRSALVVANEFIENQGDAWSLTLSSFERLIDQQRLNAAEPISETADTLVLTHRMSQIGRRTAELHLALSSHDDIADFAPEPISSDDMARWTEALLARTDARLELIRSSTLPEQTAAMGKLLVDNHEAIRSYIEASRDIPFEGMKIRHHGDFHLGQELMAKEVVFFLVFVGVSCRTLEERRQKSSPARDVAGFLRSIAYAVSAALERAPNLKPEEHETLAAQMRSWSERLGAAYWETYREAIGGVALWPDDEQAQRRLLDMFLMEKALYEIEYELTNRPDWAAIPMGAILRILNERGVTV